MFPRHEAGQLTSIFAPVNPFNETQIRERCMKMVLIFVLLQYTFVNTVVIDSFPVVRLTDYCANATTSMCASDRNHEYVPYYDTTSVDIDHVTFAACTRSAESQADDLWCGIDDPTGVCPFPDGSPCRGGRPFGSSAPERFFFLA